MTRLYFDTETTGIPKWDKPSDDPSQPQVLQLAALLVNDKGSVIESCNLLVIPPLDGIPQEAIAIHGITMEYATRFGFPLRQVYKIWARLVSMAGMVIGHNVAFDIKMMRITAEQLGYDPNIELPPQFCTMHKSTQVLQLPRAKGNGFKVPSLIECAKHFFGTDFEDEAHDAMADVVMCRRVHERLLGGK